MGTEAPPHQGWAPGTQAVPQNGLLYGVCFLALPIFVELAGAQFCFLSLGPLNGFLRHFEPLNFHKHHNHFLSKIVALSLIT